MLYMFRRYRNAPCKNSIYGDAYRSSVFLSRYGETSRNKIQKETRLFFLLCVYITTVGKYYAAIFL